MIRTRAVGFVLGQFLLVLGSFMLVPLAWGAFEGDESLRPLLFASTATLLSGAALALFLPRPSRDLSMREATLLVVVAWLGVSFFGCLPFYFTPHFGSFTDAFFESASGFTTTGATVLPDVEALPRPIQFWRCFTHWLGGMGIVLLAVAVLPLVGVGGTHLYRAEFSGARSEKLKPRITETAVALSRIYFAMSLALFVALRLAGMDVYESLCHVFSTLGTGGFSTRTASVAGFDSPLIEWILVIFMLAAGTSFVRHHRLFVERRPREFFGDYEVRTYFGIAVGATAILVPFLIRGSGYEPLHAVRAAAFQVASILTTTGFVTENFELWLPLPQVLLLVLMFVGGCTGSTAGGMKVARIAMLWKVVDREFRRMVERRAVFAIRLDGKAVPEETIEGLLSLVYLSFVVNFVSVIVLAASGVDVLTSIAATAACMFNVGPGLGAVGPVEHYGYLPAVAKWMLSVTMIAGRLEFYTVLLILTPAFWRR